MTLKLGSLCSGAGGLDMAVEQVFAAETVWHCEINEAASKVLAHRWPGVPNHRDLIATDWSTVEPIDVLCAGWPCQPFSLAGKQKGADDARAIWPHIARAVRVLRPRVILLENVAAVLRSEFGRVGDSLAALGYDLRWTCLRAGDVGAPHRRERLFVVATDTHGTGCGDAQRNGHEKRSELASPQWRDVGRRARAADVDLLPTPAAARSGRNQSPSPGAAIRPSLDMIGALLPTPNASDGSGGGQHPDRREGHSRQLIDYVLLCTPSAADGGGGHLSRSGDRSGEPLLPGQAREMAGDWGKYAAAIARWEQIAGPAPSPTEPNRNGKPRLNPAFSEWMMGWPAGWVTQVDGISRNDQLRIVGNGVVPQQAEAALQYLLSVAEVAA